jgi:hypothetical protein
MHLVVVSKFTAINLLVLALTWVTLSWLLASQLTFHMTIPPQNFLIQRFLANLQFQDYYMSSPSQSHGINTQRTRLNHYWHY